MKTFYHFSFKNAAAFLVLLLFISITAFAQTPQYYNYATGGGANMFPLNTPGGKMVQWLVAPGEFSTPSGAPSGNITKFYCRIATGYPLGPFVYQQLKLILGQSTITSLPASFYTGTMDTVFKRDTVTLQAAADTWLAFTLDHPFSFDSTKSLIIQMELCAAPGATGYSLAHTTLSGNRRGWSVGGCPFVYYGSGTNVINCGVDIAPPILYDVPDLIYYRFHNNTTNTTPNFASAPVGTNPAPFTGVNLASGGEFDTCIVGTGANGTNGVNTGWNCNLANSNWTISFWVSNLVEVVSGNPVYLFGDAGSTTFRCFYAGAAYPNNMYLRGPLTDILIPCPMPGSHVFHFVYDGTNVIIYMDGVLVSTNPRAINMPTGTGFRVAGYTGGAYSLNTGGKMDEFRLYHRALTANEIIGTWNKELPVLTGIRQITGTIPTKYNLAQNYPNPFNPNTKISFSIPKAGNVKLSVFDVLGREVKILVNEHKNAGTYDINFDASNLASGVYLYRIEAGDFKDVKKMALVK